MVVIKLVVKEPSENRKRRQLFPTPTSKKKKKKNGYLSIFTWKLEVTQS